MNRFVIGALGVVSVVLVAFAVGCAGVTTTETAEEGIVVLDDDAMQDEVGSSSHEEVGARGRSLVNSNVDPKRSSTTGVCAGCGPVPDPWANGPVPDPWNDPSSSSSSGSTSSGGSSTSGGGKKR